MRNRNDESKNEQMLKIFHERSVDNYVALQIARFEDNHLIEAFKNLAEGETKKEKPIVLNLKKNAVTSIINTIMDTGYRHMGEAIIRNSAKQAKYILTDEMERMLIQEQPRNLLMR